MPPLNREGEPPEERSGGGGHQAVSRQWPAARSTRVNHPTPGPLASGVVSARSCLLAVCVHAAAAGAVGRGNAPHEGDGRHWPRVHGWATLHATLSSREHDNSTRYLMCTYSTGGQWSCGASISTTTPPTGHGTLPTPMDVPCTLLESTVPKVPERETGSTTRQDERNWNTIVCTAVYDSGSMQPLMQQRPEFEGRLLAAPDFDLGKS